MKHLEFGKLIKFINIFKIFFRINTLLYYLDILDIMLNELNDITMADIHAWYNEMYKEIFEG